MPTNSRARYSIKKKLDHLEEFFQQQKAGGHLTQRRYEDENGLRENVISEWKRECHAFWNLLEINHELQPLQEKIVVVEEERDRAIRERDEHRTLLQEERENRQAENKKIRLETLRQLLGDSPSILVQLEEILELDDIKRIHAKVQKGILRDIAKYFQSSGEKLERYPDEDHITLRRDNLDQNLELYDWKPSEPFAEEQGSPDEVTFRVERKGWRLENGFVIRPARLVVV